MIGFAGFLVALVLQLAMRRYARGRIGSRW
jgi:hypothetical protein